jgi:hypothetical protein
MVNRKHACREPRLPPLRVMAQYLIQRRHEHEHKSTLRRLRRDRRRQRRKQENPRGQGWHALPRWFRQLRNVRCLEWLDAHEPDTNKRQRNGHELLEGVDEL